MVICLLGPPEVRRTKTVSQQPPPTKEATKNSTSDPFISLMSSEFNKTSRYNPPMIQTENLSPTFASSGNPCLDFFFHVVPSTSAPRVRQLLQDAWALNPLTTLKLICHLRGVRGTGKSNKEGGYTAVAWLHESHPQTLAKNIATFAAFGYYKDPLEILYRLIEGQNVRDELRIKHRNQNNSDTQPKMRQESREAKRTAKAKKALERYNTDANFQRLHDSVSDFFSERLKEDIKALESKNLRSISLAAKWAPTPDKMYDLATLMCESIARKIFPRESSTEYAELEEAHYVYRIRDRLRKQVLVPLRKALELPEVYMSAKRWHELPYNRVPSVAMKLYQDKFRKHDEERFKAYLDQVKSGKKTIAAGALFPHEIIQAVNVPESEEVAELQWKRMVDDMSKEGFLNNCLACSDVSGSMNGTPMEVSVALGILISELSEEPWRGKLVTFSETPELCEIKGETLKKKSNFVREMPWGMSTDFQQVFDKILEIAVAGKLKPEHMIQKLFVFSDMEFNQASIRPWETDYQAIVRKYNENGYGCAVPKIIFWNLRDSRSVPVVADQKGVALVSGFSKNMIKIFLNDDGLPGPEDVMNQAISGDEYQNLVVVD